MEVFLRNLPPDLTENALASQLRPIMDNLNITDYSCEKQKKKFTANITFLHISDAQRFLATHGQVPDPNRLFANSNVAVNKRSRTHEPSIPRLFIMKRACYCQESNRPVNKTTLKTIEYDKKRDHNKPPAPTEASITMEASELSCGYHAFINGQFTFVSEWSTETDLVVKFSKWNLIFMLQQQEGHKVKVRISYKTIIHLVCSDTGRASVALSSSPTFLKSSANDDDILTIFGLALNMPRPDTKMRASAIDDNHAAVSPFCLVYHFTVPNPDFVGKMAQVKRKGLINVMTHNTWFRHASTTPLGLFDDAYTRLKLQLAGYTTKSTLPFSLLFMLHALVHNGYLHPATISALAAKLAALFDQAKLDGINDPPVSVVTFKTLFQCIDYPHPDADPQDFGVEGIMDYLLAHEEKARARPTLAAKLLAATETRTPIYRAIVTPTRLTFHGPEMEAKNRVLRKFPNHTDFFLRVQFCDENGEDVYFIPRFSLDSVYGRFKSVLDSGIPIAGRLYTFLGFSHSSLRARSAWMSAPFTTPDGEMHFSRRIIGDLGNFDKIRSPARRAARIGQAFTETPYAVPLDERQIAVRKISDVKNGKRVFSDGVGTISAGAAEAIYDVISSEKGFPTCFQIRWAGAKGMLALDTHLSGNQICIRDSMSKFESNDKDNLEICDLAWRPAPMILNRQLIKILEDLGAPDRWFSHLQEKELERLRGVTLSVFNTASFIEKRGVCSSIRLHKLLRQVDKMGFDYRTDPFLRSTIETMLLKELRLLKHKSRIPVQKGVVLFGVMDETGFLEEGQVYVAHEPESDDLPLNGPVLVSRSPALHPGDIQTAINVMPPPDSPLKALRHCIVFSQKGERDLPSQLSGGDLDGDVYHIIWDEEVVSSITPQAPAEYPPVQLLELDRPVEPSDMSDFFIEFMKTDRLGVIASRHSILADFSELGTLTPDCLKLAELHSKAVDFSKSGHAVEIKDLPKGPRAKPDFTAPGPQINIHKRSEISFEDPVADDGNSSDDEEGPRHKYYESEKIIGRLYREVDEKQIWHERIRMTVPKGGPSFWRDFLDTITRNRVFALGEVDWHRRVNEAWTLRDAYDEAVYDLMVDCSDHPSKPLKELEVFIGSIINKTGRLNARQRDKSIKLRDEFDRISAWVIREMRNQNPEAAENMDNGSDNRGELDALELCLACVHVGCERESWEPPRGDSGRFERRAPRPIVSFRIVAASALLSELNDLEKSRRAADDALAANMAGLNFHNRRFNSHSFAQTGNSRLATASQHEVLVSKPSPEASGHRFTASASSVQGSPRPETSAADAYVSAQAAQPTMSDLRMTYPQLLR